jgi:hypothetical protein
MRRIAYITLIAVIVAAAGTGWADTHTWTGGDALNQNWSDPDNWDIGVPGAGADVVFNVTQTIDVDVDTAALNDFSVTTDRPTFNGPGKLTVNNTMSLTGSGVPEWGHYTLFNCQISGTCVVKLKSHGLRFNHADNDFSGGLELIDPGYRQFLYNYGGLGTGDIVIDSGAASGDERNFIRNDLAQASLPKVIVRDKGAFDNHHDLTGGGPIVLEGGFFGSQSDAGRSWTCGVDIEVVSNSTIGSGGRTSWYQVYYTGDITGSATLRYDPRAESAYNQASWLRHANLSFEGTWVVAEGYLKADALNCLGSGDVIVMGQTSAVPVRAYLVLNVDDALNPGVTLHVTEEASGSSKGKVHCENNTDNTCKYATVGGILVGDEVVDGTWVPAGTYDSTSADPPGIDLSDFFIFDPGATLTVSKTGPPLPPGTLFFLM